MGRTLAQKAHPRKILHLAWPQPVPGFRQPIFSLPTNQESCPERVGVISENLGRYSHYKGQAMKVEAYYVLLEVRGADI